jgi:xanthine dehydrogenase/oxidase
VELLQLEIVSDGFRIGAAVTLNRLLEFIARLDRNDYRFRALYALGKQLKRFAGNQIRNVACLGGNIATASPISDINPLLVAVNAKFQWVSCKDGTYQNAMAKDFFIGYRSTLLNESDLLVNIWIPFTNKNEYVFVHKVSRRVEDDIAIVSAAMRFLVRIASSSVSGKAQIEDVSIVYGGMAERTKTAVKTESYLRESVLEPCLLLPVCRDALEEDFVLNADSPGGMIAFRKTVALSILLRSLYQLERKSRGIATNCDELQKEKGVDSMEELDHFPFSCRSIQVWWYTLKKNNIGP